MAGRLGIGRRAATAARWPLGVCLTSWRYMWRTTPMRRSELPGDPSEDLPPALPADADTHDLQGPGEGVGALYHRRYRARIADPELSARELMAGMQQDIDAFAPSELASFQRLGGEPGPMRVGDEYVVRMPGPWDGPVRVVEVTPSSFRLATLTGHLEAGQIEFRVAGDSPIAVEIESWARSGDRFSHLLFDYAGMAKEIQLHMWTSVLERTIERSGGRRDGPLEIETRRLDQRWPAERLAPSPRRRRALAALADADLNLDRPPGSDPAAVDVHADARSQPLPSEPPGPPVPGGSWETARRLMTGYRFADPSTVRAFYDPEAPLEGRDMLLELRFWGMRFPAGVRVVDVYDDTATVAGREVRTWGWTYATLDGHLESGEMSWEVRKWLDSGEVRFSLRARSRQAPIPNPLVRVGFAVFGRRRQLRFYDMTCRRIARLVEEELRERPVGDRPTPDAA